MTLNEAPSGTGDPGCLRCGGGDGGNMEKGPGRMARALFLVAGIRCEVQQTDRAREIEVIPLRFVREGTGWVLVGAGAEAARAAWG